jgi:hypothetical protein
MTPKEKATELVTKIAPFIDPYDVDQRINHDLLQSRAKQCAVFAVDEILKIFDGLHKPEYSGFDIYEPKQYTINEPVNNDCIDGYELQEYFREVKSELEKP